MALEMLRESQGFRSVERSTPRMVRNRMTADRVANKSGNRQIADQQI
jgi:hypothetical protein